MRTARKRLGVLIIATMLAPICQANLVLWDGSPTKPADQNTATIEAFVSGVVGGTVENLLRLDSLASPAAGSPFGVTYGGQDNSASISWNLASGSLVAVYVFGGDKGANLYLTTADERAMNLESLLVSPPLAGNSGQPAGISHILFLGTTDSPSVPDGGATLNLMGLALIALSAFARMVRKR